MGARVSRALVEAQAGDVAVLADAELHTDLDGARVAGIGLAGAGRPTPEAAWAGRRWRGRGGGRSGQRREGEVGRSCQVADNIATPDSEVVERIRRQARQLLAVVGHQGGIERRY